MLNSAQLGLKENDIVTCFRITLILSSIFNDKYANKTLDPTQMRSRCGTRFWLLKFITCNKDFTLKFLLANYYYSYFTSWC